MRTTMTKNRTSPSKKADAPLDKSAAGYRTRGMSRLNVNLPVDLHRRVKIHAATFDMTTTEIVERALESYISKK